MGCLMCELHPVTGKVSAASVEGESRPHCYKTFHPECLLQPPPPDDQPFICPRHKCRSCPPDSTDNKPVYVCRYCPFNACAKHKSTVAGAELLIDERAREPEISADVELIVCPSCTELRDQAIERGLLPPDPFERRYELL